jgi:hypothetical protein
MTKSITISLLLLSTLAVTAQGAATYNAQPGRHAPPYLASKLGNHKRSGWLDRVMGANPQAKSSSSELQAVESRLSSEEGQQYKRSAQDWDDRMMDAHPEVPSRPAHASGSSQSHGAYRRSPQSWLNRVMGANPEQPSNSEPRSTGVRELEYYGSSYGLVSLSAPVFHFPYNATDNGELYRTLLDRCNLPISPTKRPGNETSPSCPLTGPMSDV